MAVQIRKTCDEQIRAYHRRPLQLLVNYGKPDWDKNSDQLIPDERCDYPFLDITRICCVWCVAVDHGNWTFGRWNCMFTQDWVLQYLFLVAGVCYGLSKRDLASYQVKLLSYFVLGVLLNWMAAIIAGWDWRRDMFDVVFHLWFVVGLMIYCTLLAPLKWYLRWLESRHKSSQLSKGGAEEAPEDDHPDPNPNPNPEGTQRTRRTGSVSDEEQDCGWAWIGLGGGLVFIIIFFLVIMRPVVSMLATRAGSSLQVFGRGADFWGLPQDHDEAVVFFKRFFTYCMCSTTNIYFMFICPRVLKRASTTTWLVILNTYIHKLFFYRAQDDRFWHGLDLMLMGMSCKCLGLSHRRKLGKYIIRYWFLVLLICALIWPPGAHQRFDEVPPAPEEKELRLRVYLLEAIFVVIWLSAGERLVQEEIFTQDKLQFLNNWGLLIFLVHKAVHMTIIAPLNWAFLLLLAPACFLWQRLPAVGEVFQRLTETGVGQAEKER